MATSVPDDHPELVAAARDVVDELLRFSKRLDRFDEVDHEQHRVFLGRADRLAGHLRASLLLADGGLFPSAFALLRTALEHQLVDQVLHTGSRYAVSMGAVDEATWELIREEYEAQETRWSRTLADAPTRDVRGRVAYVVRGIAERDADPATTTDLLHPLYFEMDKYSPTAGRPAIQGSLDDGFVPLEHRERSARANRDRWRNWLRWDALRKTLELNELTTGRDLLAIEVHYAFLSGFTHATNSAYDAALDRYGSISRTGSDHFADELVRLYVATFGASELRLLASMEDREPPVRITGRAEIEALADAAQRAAAHLWFAGGVPHDFDRVGERNRRHYSAVRDKTDPPSTSAPLDDADIGYYTDPLDRLRRMHQSFRELTTGLNYTSPWPNPTGNPW